MHQQKTSTSSSFKEMLASILLLFKMFGIGVIAATAWIHLLPDAFSNFSSACLPDAWQTYGTNYVGLFGLIAAFTVQLIEIAAVGVKKRATAVARQSGELQNSHDSSSHGTLPPSPRRILHDVSQAPHASSSNEKNSHTGEFLVVTIDHPHHTPGAHLDDSMHPHSHAREGLPAAVSGGGSGLSILDTVPSAHAGGKTVKGELVIDDAANLQHSSADHGHDSNRELTTVILELGILFHSLIIGITLGVSPDDSFTSLLVAVAFHQMFEGMSLGVLIGNLDLSVLARRLLCLAYPLTTPLGIAIGIAIHNSYDDNAPSKILAQGILNSLS
ncbi:hypothetical protein HDU84_002524 [Entophlyctis sp. JEL0112]|nr:hypothetical protein HDU84_002524 [Entophlyctis sp. JEL0112]